MTHYLAGLGIIVIGTLLGTQSTQRSSQDQLFDLREDVSNETTSTITRTSNKKLYISQKRDTRERRVRKILEAFFRKPFPSIRPDWLLNPNTKRKLEVDCYNEELRICCEVQGEQHFKPLIPYFHKDYQAFLDMRERDLMKKIMIEKRGLTLIEIPYTVSDNDLEGFILNEIYKKRK